MYEVTQEALHFIRVACRSLSAPNEGTCGSVPAAESAKRHFYARVTEQESSEAHIMRKRTERDVPSSTRVPITNDSLLIHKISSV
jgi:hypothetical protein